MRARDKLARPRGKISVGALQIAGSSRCACVLNRTKFQIKKHAHLLKWEKIGIKFANHHVDGGILKCAGTYKCPTRGEVHGKSL